MCTCQNFKLTAPNLRNYTWCIIPDSAPDVTLQCKRHEGSSLSHHTHHLMWISHIMWGKRSLALSSSTCWAARSHPTEINKAGFKVQPCYHAQYKCSTAQSGAYGREITSINLTGIIMLLQLLVGPFWLSTFCDSLVLWTLGPAQVTPRVTPHIWKCFPNAPGAPSGCCCSPGEPAQCPATPWAKPL